MGSHASRELLMKRMKRVNAGFADKHENIQKIPTGSLYMDSALNGGIPLGAVTELYGEPGSFKYLSVNRNRS